MDNRMFCFQCEQAAHCTGCTGSAGVADKVVEAVRSGQIRHFFLAGGCDGARPGRNYYTEFVKQTPPNTIVLTLA